MERRVFNLMIRVMLLILILIVTYILVTNCLMVVRRVEVSGCSDYEKIDQVIEASGVQIGQKVMQVNGKSIAEKVEALGWATVESVDITLGGKVGILVNQRIPRAYATCLTGHVVMDENGIVIETVETAPNIEGCYITGMDIDSIIPGSLVTNDEERLESMRAIIKELLEHECIKAISEINLKDTNSIIMYTDSGMRVEFGDTHQIEEKVKWLVSALEDLGLRGEFLGCLDVSSGNGADYMWG